MPNDTFNSDPRPRVCTTRENAKSGVDLTGLQAPAGVNECVIQLADTTPILPLIYGIAHDFAGDLLEKAAPDLGGATTLTSYKKLPKLKDENVRYVARKARVGYIYVFTKRDKSAGTRPPQPKSDPVWDCDAAYAVNAAGQLTVYEPQRWFYSMVNPDGRTFSIIQNGEVLDTRLLFTPDPLTMRMVEKIAKNEEITVAGQKKKFLETLQKFDIHDDEKKGDDFLTIPDLDAYFTDAQSWKHDTAQHDRYDDPDVVKLVQDRERAVKDHAGYQNNYYGQGFTEHERAAIAARHETYLAQMDKKIAKAKVRYDFENRPCRLVLEGQLFETSVMKKEEGDALTTYLKNLKGFAAVLTDPIGITQALNAYRNAGVEDTLEEWHQTTDSLGTENKRKLDVATHWKGMEELYARKVAANRGAAKKAIGKLGLNVGMVGSGRAMDPRAYQGYAEGYQTIDKDVDAETQALLDSGYYNEAFRSKYFPLVDRAAMKETEAAFEVAAQKAYVVMNKCVEDHETWLKTQEILVALDVYDNGDGAKEGAETLAAFKSGAQFADQLGMCIYGSDGAESIRELIGAWWEGKPEGANMRNNLMWRAFAGNQKVIMEGIAKHWKDFLAFAQTEIKTHEIRTALKQGQMVTKAQQTEFNWETAKVALKSVADNAEKLVGHMDNLRAAQDSGGLMWGAGALAIYGSMSAKCLSYPVSQLDRALQMRNFMATSIGKNALLIRATEVADISKSKGGIKAGVNKYVASLEGHFSKGSDFAKARGFGFLLLLEAGLLISQSASMPKEGKGKWATALAGQILITSVAALEMYATGLEALVKANATQATATEATALTARGAELHLSKLKLVGGGLALLGGVAVAITDFIDAKDLYDKEMKTRRDKTLAFAYGLRSLAGAALAGAQLANGIAAGGPFFRYLVAKYGTAWRPLVLVSNFLADKAAQVLIGRVICGASWIAIVVSIGIWWFSDDDLQKWCESSTFNAKKKASTYTNADNELAALYAGLEDASGALTSLK